MVKLTFSLAVVVVTALALVSAPRTSSAHDYQPLDLGWQWTYDNPSGGLHYMSITGERVVMGVSTRIRHQVEDTQTFENYWTRDIDGNLYLHGAYNFDGFKVAYYPPIQMVAAPLSSGKTWVTNNISLFDLDGDPWGNDPFDYALLVYFEGTVTVPAGEFYAYGVGGTTPPRAAISHGGKGYSLLGRALGDQESLRDDNTTDWYADEIGEVIFAPVYGVNYLMRSFDSPVPVAHSTWGRVRALYR